MKGDFEACKTQYRREIPTMKHFLFLALLLLAGGCVHADLTVLQEISSAANPKAKIVTTTKWKGDKIRMDASGTVSMILDSKTGEMNTLMHQQKLVVPVSAALQKMAAQLTGKSGAKSGDTLQLEPTGRKETMIGFVSEEYAGTLAGDKVSIWVTKEVPEYKELFQQLLAVAPQLKEYQGPVAGNPALQGLPLLTEITGADGAKTTIRVLAVSRESVSDAEFQIPKDYRKMEIPKIPGFMPSGQ